MYAIEPICGIQIEVVPASTYCNIRRAYGIPEFTQKGLSRLGLRQKIPARITTPATFSSPEALLAALSINPRVVGFSSKLPSSGKWTRIMSDSGSKNLQEFVNNRSEATHLYVHVDSFSHYFYTIGFDLQQTTLVSTSLQMPATELGDTDLANLNNKRVIALLDILSYRARQKYPTGTRATGTIIELHKYGATVQLEDGYLGLLHNREVSWTNRHAKASEIFQPRETIPVVVKPSYEGNKGLQLSHRETQPDPWVSIEQTFPPGTYAKGRIIRCVDYGVFVELKNGCVALLHKSQMPNSFYPILGNFISVVITAVDSVARRISLALAEASDA